jgi:hypothetical protein
VFKRRKRRGGQHGELAPSYRNRGRETPRLNLRRPRHDPITKLGRTARRLTISRVRQLLPDQRFEFRNLGG